MITIMAIVLAARFRWCRANLYQTYLNNVMAWLLLAQLLRERKVEAVLVKGAVLTVTAAQQLSCVAMILACGEFIGFTMLWNKVSPEETRRSHRYYRLAAIALSVAFLGAGTRACCGADARGARRLGRDLGVEPVPDLDCHVGGAAVVDVRLGVEEGHRVP
ncbi:hypothetical protein ACRU44_25585 [Mycobacterium colombiense]